MKYKMRKYFVLILTVLLAMSVSLPVSAAKVSVALKKSKVTLTAGESIRLKTETKGKIKKITWKSSNTNVASVDQKGTVKAKKVGKAVIRVKADGVTAKCTVVVKKADYRNLYRELLEQDRIQAGEITVRPQYFRILDIDKKGKPELIVANTSGSYFNCYVFTMKGKKVSIAGGFSMKANQEAKIIYYPKQKSLGASGWLDDSEGNWKSMYQLGNKSKLKLKRYAYEGPVKTGSDKKEYRIDPKHASVSKKKYKEYTEKYFSVSRVYEMYENTEDNRKNHIR